MMHTRNHRPRIRSEKPFRTEKNHLDAMTEESIEQFLVFQQEERYSPETLKIHRRILHYLYDFLSEGKKFYKDALAEWRETLKTYEYAISTINSFIHIANKYMGFVGHRDYQFLSRLKDDSKSESSELTREEYVQPLRTATGVIELRSAVRYLFWTNFSKRRGNYYKKSTGNSLYHETVHSRRNSGRQRECQLYLGDVSDDEGSH